MFKTYRDKMIMRQQSLAKQPANYVVEQQQQQERFEFEQKPIKKFDEFSDGEEEEFKKRAEKRSAAKREKKEELKAKKLKIKEEETKVKEGKMWDRLNELNSQFKTIKQMKKDDKKMSATVL